MVLTHCRHTKETGWHKEILYLFLLESENCVIARKFHDIFSKTVLTSQTKDH